MLEKVHLDRAVHSAYTFIANNVDPLLQKLSDRLAVAQPIRAGKGTHTRLARR